MDATSIVGRSVLGECTPSTTDVQQGLPGPRMQPPQNVLELGGLGLLETPRQISIKQRRRIGKRRIQPTAIEVVFESVGRMHVGTHAARERCARPQYKRIPPACRCWSAEGIVVELSQNQQIDEISGFPAGIQIGAYTACVQAHQLVRGIPAAQLHLCAGTCHRALEDVTLAAGCADLQTTGAQS